MQKSTIFFDKEPALIITRETIVHARGIMNYLRSVGDDDLLRIRLDRKIHEWEHELANTANQSDVWSSETLSYLINTF